MTPHFKGFIYGIVVMVAAMALVTMLFGASPARGTEEVVDTMPITAEQRAACDAGGGCQFISFLQYRAAVNQAAAVLAEAMLNKRIEEISRGLNFGACTRGS